MLPGPRGVSPSKHQNTYLNIALIYRPPATDEANFIEALGAIRYSMATETENFSTSIVTGDFNFPTISWASSDIHGCTSSDRRQAEVLLKLLEDFFMEQHVQEPTRGDNILDLFSSNHN